MQVISNDVCRLEHNHERVWIACASVVRIFWTFTVAWSRCDILI